jgi:hypothetical protein
MDNISFNSVNPSIILSKDPYCSFLVGYDSSYRITWLRPKKYRGEDRSFIANQSNVVYCALLDTGMPGDTKRYSGLVDPKDLHLLYACTTFNARSLAPAISLRSFMKLYMEYPPSINHALLMENIKNAVKNNEDVNVLDLKLAASLYRNSAEFAENKNLAPKSNDIEELKHLINEYFPSNPILLDELLR